VTNEKKQESMYDKSLFDDEMEMINKEIDELDSLYSELKGHFDAIKGSQARGSLSFVKDQTSNLISLKTAKLNYIKQKADMKKNITDFAFKEKNASKESSEGLDSFTAELYKKIANEFQYIPDKHQLSKEAVVYDESNIDQLLDDELTDVNIDSIVESTTSIEEDTIDIAYNSSDDETDTSIEDEVSNDLEDEQEEIDNSIVVVELDTLMFYKIDKDTFDVIEELGAVEAIVDTTDIDDETYAIGESGTIYLTVVFEDDE